MSDEQKKIKSMALFLGHEWHEIRSFKKFLEIVMNVLVTCEFNAVVNENFKKSY